MKVMKVRDNGRGFCARNVLKHVLPRFPPAQKEKEKEMLEKSWWQLGMASQDGNKKN